MRVSMQWLADFLPGGVIDGHAAGEALTHGGLPVELFEKVGDDQVIDVEVTSNRGDCLSHLGVAREVSALLDRPLHVIDPEAGESATPADSVTSVAIEAPLLCPHYTARIIRGVSVGPSPAWMVRRLEAVGLRAINNIVDVTNYVMYELGQPLHAFDFDRLAGRRIIVREARPGEKLVSLDGKERTLAAGMLVIADAERPVALAGVMGGADSEVSAGTMNVLLESARFDPLSVRKTARSLAMKSDSSYRFERQIDPMLPERASLRAAQLILETGGGELLGGAVCAGSPGWRPRMLTLRLARLKQVLGVELGADEVIGALTRLRLNPVLQGQVVQVAVPSYRLDLNIEVDLVEEVARVLGYERIATRDEIAIRVAPPNPDAAAIDTIRATLVAAGYFESLTFGFVSDALSDEFRPEEAAGLLRAQATVRKDNARLRPSILPGLLESVRHNEANGTFGARLFETGDTYWLSSAGSVEERLRLSLVGSPDFRELRGTVEAVLDRLNPRRRIEVVPSQRAGFSRSACGEVRWGGEAVGHIGRLDAKVGEKLALRELPCMAEVELSRLVAGTQHVPQLQPLPRFPAVRRDLSLVIAESVAYQRLEGLLTGLSLPDLEAIEYVTTYRGKPLDKGTKSVTVTLIFRSPAGTLTGEQVEAAVQQVVSAAKNQLGASLRA
jgi:phenylalanyl-tRNA synthetase beta chain